MSYGFSVDHWWVALFVFIIFDTSKYFLAFLGGTTIRLNHVLGDLLLWVLTAINIYFKSPWFGAISVSLWFSIVFLGKYWLKRLYGAWIVINWTATNSKGLVYDSATQSMTEAKDLA